jgi:hypothetical protein
VSSLDALAVDSSVAKLMGLDVEDVGDLNIVGDLGLGLHYPGDQIEIIGETPKNLVTPFKPHRSFKRRREWMLDK